MRRQESLSGEAVATTAALLRLLRKMGHALMVKRARAASKARGPPQAGPAPYPYSSVGLLPSSFSPLACVTNMGILVPSRDVAKTWRGV
jgi:hypothetical protein